MPMQMRSEQASKCQQTVTYMRMPMPMPNAQMHKCTAAKCSNVKMHKCTNKCPKNNKTPNLYCIGWVGKTQILKHAQCLCQFYELRKLNTHTGVEGCVFVAWFGQYTEIASLVSLFGFTTPAYKLTETWPPLWSSAHPDAPYYAQPHLGFQLALRRTSELDGKMESMDFGHHWHGGWANFHPRILECAPVEGKLWAWEGSFCPQPVAEMHKQMHTHKTKRVRCKSIFLKAAK